MLSWAFYLSRVFSAPSLGSCFQAPPPMGSHRSDLASAASSQGLIALGALRSLDRLGGRPATSRRWSYPHEVLKPRLPSRRFEAPSDPGSWFHLRSRATSPRPADPLRVVQVSYRSPSTGSVGFGAFQRAPSARYCCVTADRLQPASVNHMNRHTSDFWATGRNDVAPT